jgi:Glycosyl transferase family 2
LSRTAWPTPEHAACAGVRLGRVGPARLLLDRLPALAGPRTEAQRLRACIAIPARDEAAGLPRLLRALALQRDLAGRAIGRSSYEIVLLLNNCTDESYAIALASARASGLRGVVIELTLSPADAHVGWARRFAMDTACHRLAASRVPRPVILTTDADGIVARDWLAANLAEIDAGADAVGGDVRLHPDELGRLPAEVRRCIALDERYRRLVTQLRDRLEPAAHDPTPRHDQHVGASLALTCAMYRRIGGLPPLPSSEDVACVRRVRAAGGRVRHSPRVQVWTSGRLAGRATGGMATTLRAWAAAGPDGMLVAGLHELLASRGRAHTPASTPIAQAIEEIEAFLAAWSVVGPNYAGVAARRSSISSR